MPEEQLRAFIEAVKADAGLQEKLKAAANVDAVVASAKAAGFVISAEELQKAQAEDSAEELEGVAGGCNAFITGMADYIYSVFHSDQENGHPSSLACSH